MQRKPVVLILTSSDERGGAAENYAAAIRADGAYNVVTLDEKKYGAKPIVKTRTAEKLAFLREKRWLLVLPAGGGRARKLYGRNRRIVNAVKRYAPEYVLTVTPYAQAAFAEAKRKGGITVPSVHSVASFVLPQTASAALSADIYLVENGDIRDALAEKGVPPKNVAVTGLPFDAPFVTPLEREEGKQELGLPRTPTVFVNADGRDAAEILGLLVDQGDIINIVCYADDVRLLGALRRKADGAETRSNVVLITRRDMFEDYLKMSDIVVTRYEPSVIYKCFRTGHPVIAFGGGGEAERNLEYLERGGLVMRARADIDIVALIYKFMQTDTASEFTENGKRRTEMFSLANTAGYLEAHFGG